MAFRSIKTNFFVLLAAFGFANNVHALASKAESHILVSLRMIGHKLLLKSGDSSSRVLPIKKQVGKYQVDFENEFAFYPDDLYTIVSQVAEEAHLAKGYMVEAKQCGKDEVVYSFEIDAFSQSNILPCKGRELPKACYSLLFTLWGEEKLAADANNASEPQNEEAGGFMLYPIIGSLMLLIGGTFLFLRKKKQEPKTSSNLIRFGQCEFNKHNGELLIGDVQIELSGKEAELLLLLQEQRNQTVKREDILLKVWDDQGDYIGRTLDVFISKLRKKLEADPEIKIVNIRGVGYKLVVND